MSRTKTTFYIVTAIEAGNPRAAGGFSYEEAIQRLAEFGTEVACLLFDRPPVTFSVDSIPASTKVTISHRKPRTKKDPTAPKTRKKSVKANGTPGLSSTVTA